MNPLKFLRVEWQLQSIAVGFLLIGLRRQKHSGVTWSEGLHPAAH